MKQLQAFRTIIEPLECDDPGQKMVRVIAISHPDDNDLVSAYFIVCSQSFAESFLVSASNEALRHGTKLSSVEAAEYIGALQYRV